jgi:hypothetical protein
MSDIINDGWNTGLSRSFRLRRAASLARDVQGEVIGPAAKTQVGHFYECRACGQRVDQRRLGEVLHHEIPDHKPLVSS